MKYVIVYAQTETKASRGRRPRTGETVSYRAIVDYDEKANEDYDEVIMLCELPKKEKKKKNGV